eukprot:m.341104 g.341104  ORF g.341104 m.341104 type:complete len:303 (+) comp19808_c0_seq1:129-1037(+)
MFVLSLVFLATVLGVEGDSSVSSTPAWANETRIKLTAGFASASYCYVSQGLANWTCSRCNFIQAIPLDYIHTGQKVGPFDSLQAIVLAVPSMSSIVVAYRGTVSSSLQDWIFDLDATKSLVKDHYTVPNVDACQKAKAHSGFLDAYSALRNGVNSALSNATQKFPGYEIIITGHSLGASLASLTALDYVTKEPEGDISTITFGEPRTGDPTLVECYGTVLQNRTVRMTHHHDPIPMLPFQDMGFHHFPREIYLPNTEDKTFDQSRICNDSGEDPTCLDSVPFGKLVVDDHYHYLNFSMERGC